MLDLKYLRDNLDEAERRLATRGGALDLSAFRGLDARRRELLSASETLKAEKNRVSQLIGQTRDKSQVQGEIARMKEVSAQIKTLDDELKAVEGELDGLLMTIPNLPHEDAPVGRDETENREVRRWGTPRHFDFAPQAHWDLGEQLGILDFERAGKLTGARFSLGRGAGARLERALINFMLDLHTAEDKYIEILPPFMVNRDSA